MAQNPGTKSQGLSELLALEEAPVPVSIRVRLSVYRPYKARCKRRREFVGETLEMFMSRKLEEDEETERHAILRGLKRLDRRCREGERIWHRELLERAFISHGGDIASFKEVKSALRRLFIELPNLAGPACKVCRRWVNDGAQHLFADYLRYETYIENCQRRHQVLRGLADLTRKRLLVDI